MTGADPRRAPAAAGWDAAAGRRLRGADVLVAGAGAVGAPAATYIAAAGVGRVGIVDRDPVTKQSLHRGTLALPPDVGLPRAEVVAGRLGLLNPAAVIEPYPAELTAANAGALVESADCVVDATGFAAATDALNAACLERGIDLVVASAAGLGGSVMVTRPGQSACWRCARPDPVAPPSRGSLGAVAGAVGALAALAAVRLIAAVGEPGFGRLTRLDGAGGVHDIVQIERRDACQACGGAPS